MGSVELGPPDFEVAENETIKPKVQVCLIHISIFIRVAKGGTRFLFTHQFLKNSCVTYSKGTTSNLPLCALHFKKIYRFSLNESHRSCVVTW